MTEITIGQAIATIFGGFLFPFGIRMIWGKMTDEWGAIGGWMAAAFIVGTIWSINHGLETPMITQTGGVWIDMAVAAGVGVFVASAARGGNIKKALINIGAATVGGLAGGLLLSFFL